MFKVLIYNNFILKNQGGPAGYLYNLKNFFLKNSTNKIFFYNNLENSNKIKDIININQIKNWIKFIKIYIYSILKSKKKTEQFDRYDMIHFHNVKAIYENKMNLKKYKGKIILTSHSPQPLYEEILEEQLRPKYGKKIIRKILQNIDYFSFQKSDYIIFPCEESMEPYLNRDLVIKEILEKKILEKKIKFLPTGIIDKEIEYQKDYFYNKFNIPKNAIILSYLGRHNEIKGYDLLIEAGKEILKNNPNIYIIVAGKLNENKPHLTHERWIELGWTTEGDNILKHAHAYLLPNRETYFDLVFIEALRAGGTIICSETGGNKYFKKFKSSDIIFFEKENIKQLIEVIENNLEKFSAKNYVKNRKENRKIYEENFTIDKFGKKYIEIMEKIYEEGE